MIGSEFGRYKVVERLGSGGMGEVYRAQDTTLGRSVALKFLAAHLLNDDEAKQRFLREARAAAAVRHPNICHVYEVSEKNGKTFLAMDYLEGESLEERIAKGPLPLRDALDIGRQIAEGLEAAHEKGIVHRDVKPANVMIDAKGRATILDFGLARLTEASKLTRADQTVGTAAYMSPEQIQGADLDHRTDVWALGCVLYEMVAGVRPFKGQYDQALLYEIVNQEPEPLTGLRAGLPMELEVYVGKCLAKNVDERYRSAGDIAVDLVSLGKKLDSGRSTTIPVRSRVTAEDRAPLASARAPRWTPWAVSGVLAALLAAVSLVRFHQPPGEKLVNRFSFTPETLWSTNYQTTAIAPNGRHIAYVSDEPRMLWVRDLERETPRMLGGTDGARTPFWSPDSRFIAFATDRELKKIGVDGDGLIKLADLPGNIYDGGAWSPDGSTILISTAAGPPKIHKIPASGGDLEPYPLDGSPKGPAIQTPHFLPEGHGPRGLLYGAGSLDTRDVLVRNLDTGETRVLAEGLFPAYSPSGHIVYQTSLAQHRLWALPFSLASLEATGEPFLLADGIVDPSVAADGALVYADAKSRRQQLVWRDRAGHKVGEIGQPQYMITDPALAPDEASVAVSSVEGSDWDVWVHEVGRPIKRRLTTHPGTDGRPVWLPSGKEIAFSTHGSGNGDIYVVSAGGVGEPSRLVGTDAADLPTDWSRDGTYLLYSSSGGPQNSRDISYLQRGDKGEFESVPFLSSPFDEVNAQFSPDGHYVAYCSNESGRYEVYLRKFPSGAETVQVSENGGLQPRWSDDGREIFYVEGTTLMAVRISRKSGFKVESTEPLFSHALSTISAPTHHSYDVSADGTRFVVIDDAEMAGRGETSIHIVQNWFEGFRGRGRD